MREAEETRGPLEGEEAVEGLGIGEGGGHECERGVRRTAGRVSQDVEAGDVGRQGDGDLEARGRSRGKLGLGRGWRRSEAYRRRRVGLGRPGVEPRGDLRQALGRAAACGPPGRCEQLACLFEGAARALDVARLPVELGDLAEERGGPRADGCQVLERGDAVPEDARALGRAEVERGDRRVAREEHNGALRALDRRRPVPRADRPLGGRLQVGRAPEAGRRLLLLRLVARPRLPQPSPPDPPSLPLVHQPTPGRRLGCE